MERAWVDTGIKAAKEAGPQTHKVDEDGDASSEALRDEFACKLNDDEDAVQTVDGDKDPLVSRECG